MLFSKILLAYDGSKASNQALERAIELAKVTPGSSCTSYTHLNSPVLHRGSSRASAGIGEQGLL